MYFSNNGNLTNIMIEESAYFKGTDVFKGKLFEVMVTDYLPKMEISIK